VARSAGVVVAKYAKTNLSITIYNQPPAQHQ
jgi:hypothetical protein